MELQKIPSTLKDAPLPDGWSWREMARQRWGGLIGPDGSSYIVRSCGHNEGSYTEGYEVTPRYTGGRFDVPPMSYEEACRFAYTQLMLGNDGP